MKNEELVRTLSETAASKTIVTRIARSRMNGFTHLVKSLAIASLLLECVALQAQTSPPLSGDQIIERASPAVVLILAGSGDGKVVAIGSGLIVRPDGIVLTANHVVKGMKEVQIRLKNGEVYDRVELITADERRDIAALRILATDLAVLPVANFADIRAGSSVFAVSNGAGLPWTATSGVISAVRRADEVPGAGSGYRLLQFTAPLSPGSSGGVLVDTEAHALAIVVGSLSAGQNVNFAIPLDSIVGLATIAGGTPFASGSQLQLPSAGRPGTPSSPGSATNLPPGAPQLPPADQLQIKTISVYSKTIFLRRERFQDDLRQHPLFRRLGLRFADYNQTADVAITVDRPFLTFDWTYNLVFQPSSLTLATGTIIGDDEFDAGPKLAAAALEQLAAASALPRSALNAAPLDAHAATVERTGPTDPASILRTCKTIFVESHTIYLKGNLLQDALYTRPEIRDWGIRVVDDRPTADVYIDVTRPALTFDWEFKVIDNHTGAVLGTGKTVAWDGHIAAPQLAIEIIKIFRAARPLPTPKETGLGHPPAEIRPVRCCTSVAAQAGIDSRASGVMLTES